MPKSKLIVEEGVEVTKGASGKKTYVFNQNKTSKESYDLGNQGVIEFSRQKDANGLYPDFGTFVTTDQKVANALRAYAEKNPHARIFEKQ